MNETNGKRGVLFDLDGVLLDSEGQYSIFWQEMDAKYHTSVPNFANFIKGFHLGQILEYFANDDIRHQIVEELLEYEQNMKFDFFPGALDFVKRLRDAGVPIAIVTSSDKKKMASLYAQHPEFPGLFDCIVTGDMVTHSKPDPECFVLAAKQLGLDAKNCIVFEDSRNGLKAGRDSGASIIGVATTLTQEEVSRMSDMNTDAVAHLSVEQVLNCKRPD